MIQKVSMFFFFNPIFQTSVLLIQNNVKKKQKYSYCVRKKKVLDTDVQIGI